MKLPSECTQRRTKFRNSSNVGRSILECFERITAQPLICTKTSSFLLKHAMPCTALIVRAAFANIALHYQL
jgi:hypothetical protein